MDKGKLPIVVTNDYRQSKEAQVKERIKEWARREEMLRVFFVS